MHIIAGSHKNRLLKTPKGSATRPTSSRLRETLFNICQGCVEGATFLDLFAGSGAMGLEALSRGASHATFVDDSRSATRCIATNLKTLDLEAQSTLLCADVFLAIETLARKKMQFDLIYIDPPYDLSRHPSVESSYSLRLLLLLDKLPLMKEGGLLFIEDTYVLSHESFALESLKLISSRRAGRAFLCEYQKGTPDGST